MAKKKKRPQGHYCKICGQYKANEKFSGKGHATHICKTCSCLSAAEIHSGMSYPKNELIYNRARNNQLMEEKLSEVGSIAYFAGGAGEEGTVDNRQWLEAVQNGTEPLVKPEEALAVTRILDAIYKSAKMNETIKF